MRNFWILIGLLSIAAGAWIVLGNDNERGEAATDVTPISSVATTPTAAAQSDAPAAPPEPAPAPAVAEATTPAEPAAPLAAAPEAPSEPAAEPVEVVMIPEPAAPAEPEPQPAAPEVVSAPADEPAAPEVAAEPAPETPAESPNVAEEPAPQPETTVAAAPAAPAANGEPAIDPAKAEEKPAAPSLKAHIERQPDGSMIVDKRFVVKGSGTVQDPYRVTWDMLVSAAEVYQPREGRTELPERITMLAGKHVQITGNIAFPLMAQEANELLAMLNQWDGCCIGVPPTPYDAIEVRLRDPAEGSDRFTTFGTVTGRLDVKPHLVGNWLVGLYVMDDATLKPGAYDGFGS